MSVACWQGLGVFPGALWHFAASCQCPWTCTLARADGAPRARGLTQCSLDRIWAHGSAVSLRPVCKKGHGCSQRVIRSVSASFRLPPLSCCFTMHFPGVSFLVYSPG